MSTPTARRIVIRGTLTGEGALPLQTSYGGLAWRSTATLGALVLGNARGGEGAASVVLTAFATSFSANSAAARATATDAAMNAVDLRHGEVAREGSLTGTLGWDASGGAIELTGSEIAIRVPAPRRAVPPQGARLTPLGEAPAPVAPVPEPSTWMMMILGFGAVGSVLRRRPGLRSPDRNRVPATRRSARRPARR